MEFSGRVAVVTGAAVGIGRATVMQFLKEGAKVAALDVDAEKLTALQEELDQCADNLFCGVCDVSNAQEVTQVIDQAAEKFGGIDILVNNAALWRYSAKFLEIPLDIWPKFLDINVMGVVHCIRAAMPYMLEKRYGRIINVASVAGVYGNGYMTNYSATKGAVISMTKALAKEVAKKGITVNAVSPGSVSTSANPDIDFAAENELSHMGRTGTNRENADLICFLASEKAGYISGQNIQNDGCRKRI